jgi:hypothetical protein
MGRLGVRRSRRRAGARLRPARTCTALLLLVGGTAAAPAQDEGSTGPSTQIWANLTLGKSRSETTYLELDIEPKRQVSEGEEWRNIDFTPLLEYYPTDWLDLTAETTIGNTRQRDGLDTFEITPRVGVRFHLFAKMAPHRPEIPGLKYERLPLTRLAVGTLVRVEWRNFFYSDETPSQHTWRARLRLEGKLALNHATLVEDRTLYAIGDAEYYQPLGDDIEERYVNKVRSRLGLGYRFSATTKLEFLYIRDWNRDSPEEEGAQDVQAFDFKVKLLF